MPQGTSNDAEFLNSPYFLLCDEPFAAIFAAVDARLVDFPTVFIFIFISIFLSAELLSLFDTEISTKIPFIAPLVQAGL